ncbi:MAG: M48 family metallopeptidase [Planctomycetota bacterium]
MLLPFLLCVLLLYVPLPGGGGAPPVLLTVAGVAALAAVNAGTGWLFSRLAIRLVVRSGEFGRMAASKLQTGMKGAVVGFVIADVFVFRWPAVVVRLVGHRRWALGAEDALLLLPVVVMMLTLMAWQHRVEARLGRVTLSLPRYLWMRFRLELGIVLLPWAMLVLAADLTEALFAGSEHLRLAGTLSTGGVLAGIVVFSPALLRRMWRCSTLPDGPLRERLQALCRQHGFTCDGILVWHTDNHLANAAVVGPTPLLRYVMVTDALINRCTRKEVASIFAHEVGHIERRHLPFYAGLAAAFIAFYANLMDLLALTGRVQPLSDILAFDITLPQAIVLLLFAVLYWVVLFGWVSRRMELEADLFSLASVEDPGAFLTALEKLGIMSTSPREASHWRHFSIARRVDFLSDVLEDPGLGKRFLRRMRYLKIGVMAAGAAALVRLLVQRPELFGL